MPFIPLHAGPAFLVKIFAPRWVSLPVFGVANVLIDAEVLYHRFAGNSPDHRHLHSFVEAMRENASTIFAGSPPRPRQSRRVAVQHRSGSWGRQTPG